MSDIFQEVDEDLRRERYLKLWRAYGRYVIAAAAVVIVAVGGYQGWRSYQTRLAADAGAAFSLALADAKAGKFQDAASAFSAVAKSAPAGYRALALIQSAAALANAGQFDDAIAAFDQAAAAKADAEISALAQLMAGLLVLEHGQADQLEARLRPLADGNAIWKHQARELLAASLLKSGNKAKAREAFLVLADDPAAPSGIRARAAEVAAALAGAAS